MAVLSSSSGSCKPIVVLLWETSFPVAGPDSFFLRTKFCAEFRSLTASTFIMTPIGRRKR
jgi:hypothetical protein